MNLQYNSTYEYLFKTYERSYRTRTRPDLPPYRQDFIENLKKIIEAKSFDGVRADAKYFLLVNFDHLILTPILVNNSRIPRSKINIENLSDDITIDIIAILDYCKKYNLEEISGHQIMKAIDSIWLQLKTTQLNIWG